MRSIGSRRGNPVLRFMIDQSARRWHACLRTRTAPGLASPHWGHPVYGARLDPANDELDVVWAAPGDWVAFAFDDESATRSFDSPRHWASARPSQAGLRNERG